MFTPIEYGCVGLSEDDALAKFALESLKIYRTAGTPLEWAISAKRTKGATYIKLICNVDDDERVLGFHILSPNAAEITQAVALGVKLGARKEDFDDLVGIHPSVAELMTTITTTEVVASCLAVSCVGAGCSRHLGAQEEGAGGCAT